MRKSSFIPSNVWLLFMQNAQKRGKSFRYFRFLNTRHFVITKRTSMIVFSSIYNQIQHISMKFQCSTLSSFKKKFSENRKKIYRQTRKHPKIVGSYTNFLVLKVSLSFLQVQQIPPKTSSVYTFCFFTSFSRWGLLLKKKQLQYFFLQVLKLLTPFNLKEKFQYFYQWYFVVNAMVTLRLVGGRAHERHLQRSTSNNVSRVLLAQPITVLLYKSSSLFKSS